MQLQSRAAGEKTEQTGEKTELVREKLEEDNACRLECADEVTERRGEGQEREKREQRGRKGKERGSVERRPKTSSRFLTISRV